ncbi:MAG: hypothetical protein MRJ67_03250 [Nitrospirales bacterium]|nr:hypothetical protein [Nitrospirales bacterium]
MITVEMREDLRSRFPEIAKALELDSSWLDSVCDEYNSGLAVAGEGTDSVDCNPLLTRLLFDRFREMPGNASGILNLVHYYRKLPEASHSGWRQRRAGLIGDNFSTFHTTVTEIALHWYLAETLHLGVRFVEPIPGGPPTPDFEISHNGIIFPAELKSILVEALRLQPRKKFLRGSLDLKTTRGILERYRRAIQKRQIKDSNAGVVIVDITCCEELLIFLDLAATSLGASLRDRAFSLLYDLSTANPDVQWSQVLLFLFAIDPYNHQGRFLAPVNTGFR